MSFFNELIMGKAVRKMVAYAQKKYEEGDKMLYFVLLAGIGAGKVPSLARVDRRVRAHLFERIPAGDDRARRDQGRYGAAPCPNARRGAQGHLLCGRPQERYSHARRRRRGLCTRKLRA